MAVHAASPSPFSAMFASYRPGQLFTSLLKSSRRFASTDSTRNTFMSHLWRSFFYVPGDRPNMIEKIAALPGNVSSQQYATHVPDLVVLDCEDAVSLDRKNEARKSVADALSVSNGGSFRTLREDLERLVMVRINSLDSEFAQDDIKQVLEGAATSASNSHGHWPGPDLLCLPKVTSIADLDWLSVAVDDVLSRVYGFSSSGRPSIGLVAMIESCNAVVGLHSLCESSKQLKIPLVGLVFGSDDYCVSLGVERSPNNLELTYARQYIPVIAKAYNLSAIDMVDINYKDLNCLRENCHHGVQLGYRGKQTIHPSQLPIVNGLYSPVASRVEWCRDLLAEAEKHSAGSAVGAGAFTFRGRMIDRPTLRQAEHVLKQASIMKM